MTIRSLALQNFRSYAKKTFTFSPHITLITGQNASGKTNILEAIMLLATGKSFRAGSDREAIRWSEDIARISAEVGISLISRRQGPDLNSMSSVDGAKAMTTLETKHLPALEQLKLEMVLSTGFVQGKKVPLKKYIVNGVSRRMVDFVGNLRVVLFWPEDLEIITDSPSIRRRYLDTVLVQVDREYRRNLLSYERGIRQRNKLLDLVNDGKASRSQLLFWNQLVIRTGGYLTDTRSAFIDFINETTLANHHFGVTYDKSVISESRLEQYKEEEIQARATLVGPHRDDFHVIQDDRDLSTFGSRGEQRIAVLWLKLAEIDYIERETGSRPILLLDDIFSELDEMHRELVVHVIEQQQTIITSAEKDIITLLSERVEHISL